MKFTPMSLSSITTALLSLSYIPFLPHVSANTRSCLNKVDDDVDYFPDKVSPKYSKQWSMSYHNTYKILTNHAEETSFLMYQCGTEPPESEAGKHDLTFSVPLQDGVVLSSTTHIPKFEQLGLRRQVRAYLGSTFYVTSPCLRTMIDEKSIEVLDYDWVNTTDLKRLGEFRLEHPDTIVIQSNGNTDFAISENTEGGNLPTYEWHKVVASLFNLEATANAQFEEAEERYLCNSDNAATIAEQRRLDSGSNKEAEKPTVVWAYHSTYYEGNYYWDVARCDDKFEYYCEFAEKCSANLLHSNNGTIPNTWAEGDFHMTDEEFFEFAKDADYFIYTDNNWDATYARFKDDLDKFKSVQNEEVYDTAGSGLYAWFEGRVAEFDIVLQDFCDVVGHYDETLAPPHKRHYLRKVIPAGVEPLPDLGTCEPAMVDLPWETRASDCVVIPNVAVGLSSTIGFLVPLCVVVALSLFGL